MTPPRVYLTDRVIQFDYEPGVDPPMLADSVFVQIHDGYVTVGRIDSISGDGDVRVVFPDDARPPATYPQDQAYQVLHPVVSR